MEIVGQVLGEAGVEVSEDDEVSHGMGAKLSKVKQIKVVK